jgi:microcystin-dependent protein
MARRCGCASDSCSCFLVEGPGISITGSGSESNKYVISSLTADIETGVDVQLNNTTVINDVHRLDFRGTAVSIVPGTDEAVITINQAPPPEPGAPAYVPPTGALWMWAGGTPPVGWLLCDGSLVPISSYTALFAVLGNKWGGDGVTTFGLPPLVGRFPLGASPAHPLGAVPGGSETKTIAAANLPPHAHTINHDHAAANTNSAGGHQHDLLLSQNTGSIATMRQGGSGATESAGPMRPAGAHVHSLNVPAYTGDSGSGPGQGTPLDIMPPFLAVNFIIHT